MEKKLYLSELFIVIDIIAYCCSLLILILYNNCIHLSVLSYYFVFWILLIFIKFVAGGFAKIFLIWNFRWKTTFSAITIRKSKPRFMCTHWIFFLRQIFNIIFVYFSNLGWGFSLLIISLPTSCRKCVVQWPTLFRVRRNSYARILKCWNKCIETNNFFFTTVSYGKLNQRWLIYAFYSIRWKLHSTFFLLCHFVSLSLTELRSSLVCKRYYS